MKTEDKRCSYHPTGAMFFCIKKMSRNRPCAQKVMTKDTICYRHSTAEKNPLTCIKILPSGKSCNKLVIEDSKRCPDHPIYIECGAKTKKTGLPCNQKTPNGIICYRHREENERINPNFEHEEDRCPLCNELESWKWMKDFGFSKYMISSLGKIYNMVTSNYLKGGLSKMGYQLVELSSDVGKPKTKGIHVFQGIVFFDLEPLYGDKRSSTTMDHINRRKTENYTCCNLLPASPSQQNKNKPNISQSGKAVLKIAKDGEIIKLYTSITRAKKELKVSGELLGRYLISGKMINGYMYRFLKKNDLSPQQWKSTSILYPQFQPPAEISDKGWILRSNGALTRGFKSGGLYFSTHFGIEEKSISKLMHDMVWTVFNNKFVPKGYELSHKNSTGRDNRLVNIELTTHSKNMMTTIFNGMNKNCIAVRQYFHNGTYRDHISIAEAARCTTANESSIRRILKGKLNTSGKCKCGKRFTWKSLDSNGFPVESEIIRSKKRDKKKDPVKQCFHDDTYIDHENIDKAVLFNTNVSRAGILAVLRGAQKTSGKCKCGKIFGWKWLDEKNVLPDGTVT
uniref:HNH nuclease domain-containing protein n=1 Tax=Pithovirus LCPAC403 TaxID=2506596 RepID=A0A481ZDI0_9VIRU|nr:MAG: uncharacterized protein LCPAC403_02330 [Pithovirus LCPAC403]